MFSTRDAFWTGNMPDEDQFLLEYESTGRAQDAKVWHRDIIEAVASLRRWVQENVHDTPIDCYNTWFKQRNRLV
jgi:hypothetical protein